MKIYPLMDIADPCLEISLIIVPLQSQLCLSALVPKPICNGYETSNRRIPIYSIKIHTWLRGLRGIKHFFYFISPSMTEPSMNFNISKMVPIYSASVPKRGQPDSESETLNSYQFLFWCLYNYTNQFCWNMCIYHTLSKLFRQGLHGML